MNKKNILLALLILGVVVLTIVGTPPNAVFAHNIDSMETHIWGLPGYPALELAGYYWVDFIEVDTEHALLQRGGVCPTPCNTWGEGEGYTQFIGYGDGHAECWSNAVEQANMTEEQRDILWASTGPCFAPEVGQTACVWYCCQPYPPVQYWGWREWDDVQE